MTKSLRENWHNYFLFLWASIWMAGALFGIVNVCIRNRELESWGQALEILILLNIFAFIAYGSFKVQLKIIKELEIERKKYD